MRVAEAAPGLDSKHASGIPSTVGLHLSDFILLQRANMLQVWKNTALMKDTEIKVGRFTCFSCAWHI